MNITRPTPGKDDIALLPEFPRLGLDRISLVASAAMAREAVAALSDHADWGFDTESKPTFAPGEVSDGPHILQLATLSQAWVFQLHDPASRDAAAGLMADASRTKAGFGLRDDTLRSLIPEVKEKGADAVVVLGHENLNNMKKIAESVPGIDLALAAHDHRATEAPEEVTRADGSKSWVAEADAYGRMVGQIDLLFEGDKFKGVEGFLHEVNASAPSDPEAEKTVNTYEAGPKIQIQDVKKQKTVTLNSFADLAKHFAENAES